VIADGGPLAGRRVLVPVAAGRERALVSHLDALGATVTTAVLAQIAPAADPQAVTAALDPLAAGGFAWLAVTSSHAVDALEAAAAAWTRAIASPGATAPAGLAAVIHAGQAAVPGSTRVAAVGPATARALAAVGIEADLLPTGERSARGLLDAWPTPPAQVRSEASGSGSDVLLAQGDLAEPVLAEGLVARGWHPSAVVVYRNLPAPPLDATLLADLAAGSFDAVLLTSGSVADRLFAQLRDHAERFGASGAPKRSASWAGLAEGTRFVALGPRTAEVLVRSGVTVAAASEGPDAEAVALAILAAVGHVPASHETPATHGPGTLGRTPPSTEEPA